MRRKKGLDPNMKFLFGSVFFFFILLIIIGLFSYFTLQQFWHNDAPDTEQTATAPIHDYSISFDESFKGARYTLYINDDVIYKGEPVDPDTVIYARRKAVENSLIVVDNDADIIKDIIELSLTGKILLKLNNGILSYTIE